MHAVTHSARGITSLYPFVFALLLASCGGGGGGGGDNAASPTYHTIGGTVSGLTGTGLVLQNNGGDLAVSADGAFTFSTSMVSGSTYAVTVLTQPTNPSQTCTVAGGTGTVSANVTNVAVSCVTNLYTLRGTVSGLAGSGLVLQNNGGNSLPVSANGTFTFTTLVASGAAYSVTVSTQPSNLSQTCTVTGGDSGTGSGTVGAADVTNVSVSCTTNAFTVGGTVSGYNNTTLQLRLNGTTIVSISGDGPYAFPAMTDGSPYGVLVFASPPNQTCTIANGSGTLAGANVTNVAVTCATNTFTIGGTVSGLSGTGLVLRNNGGDNLAVSADGAFTFSAAIAQGSAYNVTVFTQPTNPSQTCTVTGGLGTLGAANVTNVVVNCVTNTYTIGGTISGLSGSGLVLQYNGANNHPVSGSSFTFTAPIGSGSAYVVTVLSQPTNPTQNCTVANGSGTVTGNVTNVAVTCVTSSFTIGGSVNGLSGSGLVLQNNGLNDVAVAAGGSAFTFTAPIASGATYGVTVFAQPTSPSQTCTVTGGGSGTGSGTVGSGAVTNVVVTCVTNSFTIGGTITGLSGTVVLQNNGGDNLSRSTNGVFTFTTPVASAAPYAVTVLTQPTSPISQTCTVTGGGSGTGTGTVGSGAVANVVVTCVTNTFAVGGTISGLSGSGLVLRNNGLNDLTVAANATGFTFSTAIASGAAYGVTVFTQPTSPSQTCTVTGGDSGTGTGTVGNGPVTNVVITCVTNTFTVGGTITGLSGTVVLRNNGGDNLSRSTNGAFTFTTQVASGAAYAVTVLTQPTNPISQTCAVTGGGSGTGSGNVGNGPVTTVVVTCVTDTFTIGGTVSGLSGTGLVLRNNGGNNLTIPADGAFTFTTPVASGAAYLVSVFTQPSVPKQVCTVSNGAGTVGAAAVTGVSVACVGYTAKFAYVANRGVANPGISAYTINAGSGALTQILCGGGAGCSGNNFSAGTTPRSVTVDPSGKFAYAANQNSDDVSAYTINAGTGALTQILCGGGAGCVGNNFLAGSQPSSVSVDPSGKFAYVANLAEDDVSAYTINATTGALTQILCGGGAGCVGNNFSAGSNPWSVSVDPSGRFAYVANNGSANVSAYTINATTGALTAMAGSPYAAGTGPWSVSVDPAGKFAYVANFIGSDVSAYTIDATTGALTQILCGGGAGCNGNNFLAGNGPIAVTVDPKGKVAYVANYHSSNVSAFTIDANTGALTPIGAAVLAGTNTISVNVDPSGKFAYATNETSNDVSAYTIDAGTGALTQILCGGGAGCNVNNFLAGTTPWSVTTTGTIP